MLRNRSLVMAVIVVSVAASSLAALPQGKGLITQKTISTDLAMEMAQGALAKCRSLGAHVSVHVIDITGIDKVAIRDDGSGEVNFTVSRQKAFTSLTYAKPSSEMAKTWANMSPARIIPGTFGVAGGLPIIVGGETIGAIGVGGGHDEECAAAGLAKVADQLK